MHECSRDALGTFKLARPTRLISLRTRPLAHFVEKLLNSMARLVLFYKYLFFVNTLFFPVV